MKIVQYSIIRALCAVAVGALLVKYREEMVEWMTIAIGALFFVSGLVAMIISMSRNRNRNESENGKQPTGVSSSAMALQSIEAEQKPQRQETRGSRVGWGTFVALGCMILGLILALMPKTFVGFLVYIISGLLIIGAIQQFVTLAIARKNGTVGFFYWVMPALLLCVGCVALFKPTVFASAPLFFIGWFMMIYGIVECVNSLKARSNRKKAEREQNFYNANQRPDFSNAEVVEAEEVE